MRGGGRGGEQQERRGEAKGRRNVVAAANELCIVLTPREEREDGKQIAQLLL